MKIDKGTMIFEIITKRFFETAEDVDEGNILVNVYNQKMEKECILVSTIQNAKYYKVHQNKKFVITKNNTNIFLAAYNESVAKLNKQYNEAQTIEEKKEIYRKAFFEPAKNVIDSLDKLDKNLGVMQTLIDKFILD